MKTQNVDTSRTLPPHFTMGNYPQTPLNQAAVIMACGDQGAMVSQGSQGAVLGHHQLNCGNWEPRPPNILRYTASPVPLLSVRQIRALLCFLPHFVAVIPTSARWGPQLLLTTHPFTVSGDDHNSQAALRI